MSMSIKFMFTIENNYVTSYNVMVPEVCTKQHNDNRVENDIKPWLKNTVLIAGDSILNGIEDHRLSKTRNVKLRAFPGAYIDMYNY